ncbi:MAG: sporulation integral membrane protein YtvI [Oscillospiraceae bacterium]|nr:sporulation integral membrane protein YtvI [Oscillospiraceae bacterium]
MSAGSRNYLFYAFCALLAYLAVRFLLPAALPFLLGAGLALAAEPLVALLSRRLPRGVAAGVGVTLTFAIVTLLIAALCAFVFRELGLLANVLPELLEAAKGGMESLEIFLTDLVSNSPEAIRPLLTEQVESLFSGGSALLDRVTRWLLSLATGIIGRLPDSALGFGTGIIASFMISAKLPKWKAWLRGRFPTEKLRPALETLRGMKTAVFGWLKAQMKLSGVTWAIVTAGFLLLGIRYAPLWAVAVALVDAFPILGTGTVLVPWSLVSFLQGDAARAFGLLGLYGALTLIRSLLEPRLVGRQLGLDPLVTLIALYAGYRLWGLMGMILSPILAVTAVQLVQARKAM